MANSKADKKTEKAKKQRPDPFQENMDHLEEISLGYLNTFISSIELPRENALAFRVCQVLEEGAMALDTSNIVFPGLSETFPKKRLLHKTREESRKKEMRPLEDDVMRLEAELSEMRKKTQKRPAELRADDSEDGQEYRRLENELDSVRRKRVGLRKKFEPYKPRYGGSNAPEAMGRVDPEDWAQVKTYFAEKVATAPKREEGRKNAPNATHANLLRMSEYLGLSPDETKILEFALVGFFTFRTQSFFTEVSGGENNKNRGPMRKCIARGLNIKPADFARIMAGEGPLYHKGLLQQATADSIEGQFGIPCIDEDIMGILQEPGIDIDTIISRILGDKKIARRKWSDYEGMGEYASQLERFVEGRVAEGRGASILLVSDFGIGKSTMIEALCDKLGVDLFVPGEKLDNNVDADGKPLPASVVRFNAWMHGQALLAARYTNGGKKRRMSALFMDEIGDLVASKGLGRQSDGSYAEGSISRLQTHNAVEFPGVITFFAGNNQTQWDPAFLSRMDLIVPLRLPSRGYRKQIWQIQVLEQKMSEKLSEHDIEDLATRLRIPPRLIEKAVGFARSTEGGSEQALFYLKSACTVLYGGIEEVEVTGETRAPFFPELLNPEGTTWTAIEARMKDAANTPVTLHINGPDGSGKRLMAQHFATLAGKQIEIVGADDLMGKNGDETRANIRGIFRAAAEQGSLLHLCGIDSIIDRADPRAMGTSELSLRDTLDTELGDQLRRTQTPVILTTRHDTLQHISPNILTAFTSTVHLQYLHPAQVRDAVERLGGEKMERLPLREKEITPADVADALRQMRAHKLDAAGLGAAIDDLSRARRGAQNFVVGFRP